MTPDRPATNIEPFVRKKSGEDVHRLFIDDPTKNDANKVYLNPWDNWDIKKLPAKQAFFTEKNNKLPFLDILRYLKNTHKNPKFGKVRQVQTREFPTKFPGRDLSHSSKLGIFVGILYKYPKISKNGNLLFFPVCYMKSILLTIQTKYLNVK